MHTRSMTGLAEMQSASRGLLGVHGDGVVDSSGRRIMTPQREYPIFTPVSRQDLTTLYLEGVYMMSMLWIYGPSCGECRAFEN